MDYQIPTDQISARDEGVSRENVSPGTEKARVKVWILEVRGVFQSLLIYFKDRSGHEIKSVTGLSSRPPIC